MSDESWQIIKFNIYSKNLKIYPYDIFSVVAFLIGHFLFKEDIIYPPIHQFNVKGNRVYNKAHLDDY